jgi:hypothetical protein
MFYACQEVDSRDDLEKSGFLKEIWGSENYRR